MATPSFAKIFRAIIDNLYWVMLTLCQLLQVLCCFSVLPENLYLPFQYNTDYLYLPSLYTDLFEDGGNIGSWYLTPSPYFFPDMILYFPICAIVKNIGVSFIIYGFIQIWLMGYFFYKILILWTDKENARRYFLYAFVGLNLFLVLSVLKGEHFMASLLLSRSAHIGAVLCSLIAIFLYLKYLKTAGNGWLVSLGVIIIISALSDRIFIVQTCAPLIILSLYLAIKNKSWKPFIFISVASFLGWLSFKLVREWVTFIPENIHSGQTVSKSVGKFIADLCLLYVLSPITGFLLYVHLIILCLLPFGWLILPKEKRRIYTLLVMGCIISFVTPILLAFIQDIDTFRYLMHSYIYVILIVSVFPALVIKSKYLRPSQAILFVFVVMLISLLAVFKVDKEKLTAFINYKSSYVQLVESNQSLLKNGVSDYWHTKEIYLMGGKKSRVVQLYPGHLTPHKWQINKKWYTGTSEPPLFNFSINMRVDKIVGPPIDSICGPNDTLRIYNDFIFKNVSKHDIRMFPLTPVQ